MPNEIFEQEGVRGAINLMHYLIDMENLHDEGAYYE